ncbi:MAG: hypothetical protein LBC41_09390, partial [Clostridiales bacterium]|nr:hypothetical protein [Clostridiales bacterium]
LIKRHAKAIRLGVSFLIFKVSCRSFQATMLRQPPEAFSKSMQLRQMIAGLHSHDLFLPCKPAKHRLGGAPSV